MNSNDGAKYLKREILIRIVRAFYEADFAEKVRLIPYEMRPKGCEVNYRCCVHKERAVLKDRIIAALGFAIEEDDEQTLLSEYAKRALNRTDLTMENPLTILETACRGCVPSRIRVTDLCQGCVARPCTSVCKFGAIKVQGGRAAIDPAKCKNCSMCLNVCQYKAIAKVIVPCENACPVGAIAKNEHGHAKIDFAKCIACGKCISACPFGAVHERLQLIDVLQALRSGQKVIALMAPALVGQLPCSAAQLHTAIKQIGFTEVYEVAQGADCTARHEAQDLEERLARGDAFMTTSCCAGYNELVAKHLPELLPFKSATPTPLHYTAALVKEAHPEALTVFLTPCAAKRQEVQQNPQVDYVLSFEELGALFIALKIEVNKCVPEPFAYTASKQGRNFAVSRGVAESVNAAWRGAAGVIKPVVVSGVNQASIKQLKRCAQERACDAGNLIEVMCCEGGCAGGNATINTVRMSCKQINEYAAEGPELSE